MVAVLLSGAVSACGSITMDTIKSETGPSAYFAPGGFYMYTCSDLDRRLMQVIKRKNELEQLMGRASGGAGGSVVNVIAYRTEYMQSRDELVELSHAAADKQCSTNSQFSSGRAVF